MVTVAITSNCLISKGKKNILSSVFERRWLILLVEGTRVIPERLSVCDIPSFQKKYGKDPPL